MVDGRVVASLGAGDDFGGGCIVRNLTHPTTIVADTAMTVLVMGVREFRTVLQPGALAALARRRRDRPPAARTPRPLPTPSERVRSTAEVDYTLAS